jgi:hypothetical protein
MIITHFCSFIDCTLLQLTGWSQPTSRRHQSK